MQKLHQFFLLTLLICSAQSEAMQSSADALAVQQCLLPTEKNFTPQEFAFELFCRDHFSVKPDREMVLEYIKDLFQDVNKCTPGIILFENDAAKQPWHKNIKIDDKFRQPCLHRACMKSDEEIVSLLLQRTDVNVNERNSSGSSALQYTSNIDIARLLLKHGADVNHVCDNDKTALHSASFNENLPVVELLLAQKNIIIRKAQGETPFFFAARGNNGLLNVFLNSEKVALHKTNSKKQTWFYVAWYYKTLHIGFSNHNIRSINSLDIFKQFDDSDKKIFLTNELYALPKMYFLLGEHCDLMEFIQFCIENGADVQMCDAQGKRPVDSAWDTYHVLKGLVNSKTKQLIVKEMVLHALLCYTGRLDSENIEYELERCVGAAHIDGKYRYDWDKS